MHDGNMWYRDASGDICERFDISEIGYGILEGYSCDIYAVEDAVTKLLDTLEWVDNKIEYIFNGISMMNTLVMEHPTEMGYEATYESLSDDLQYFTSLRNAIAEDVNSLTGHQVPFD